jgi:hypothetical protein
LSHRGGRTRSSDIARRYCESSCRHRVDEQESTAERPGATVGLFAVTDHHRVLGRDAQPRQRGLEDRRARLDRPDFERQYELVDVVGCPDRVERRPDVEGDVGDHRGLDALAVQALEHIGGVRVRGPRGRVDHPFVERLGVMVGQPRSAEHMQVRLAVQMRFEVAVDPRFIGFRGYVDGTTGRCGEPAHQLGLHVCVDFAFVDLHALKPAVVLFETEQCAGVVEKHGAYGHS